MILKRQVRADIDPDSASWQIAAERQVRENWHGEMRLLARIIARGSSNTREASDACLS